MHQLVSRSVKSFLVSKVILLLFGFQSIEVSDFLKAFCNSIQKMSELLRNLRASRFSRMSDSH